MVPDDAECRESADLLTRAEYTQQMYEQDRKSLEKYVEDH